MSSAAEVDQKAARGPIPRGAAPRAEIAQAAEKVFLEHGFAETTMQMVALAAGSSKETLYRHFGSKEDLFIEVVDNRNNEVRQVLDSTLESDGPIPIVLQSVGIALLECMCSPHGGRAGSHDRERDSQASGARGGLLRDGAGPYPAKLTGYLAEARTRGEFTGDYPARGGGDLHRQHHGQIRSADAVHPPHTFAIDPDQIKDHVAEAVSVFAKTYVAKDR